MQDDQPGKICEETVYDAVFQQVAPLLRNYLYYKTGSAEEAEDLMQDAFLKLWDNCAKVLPDGARRWVFRVADNLFLNKVAHQKVVLKFQRRMLRTEPTDFSPQELLEEKEFGEKLERALAALPPGAREVFILNRIDGLKYREIAELLDISVKAVEKRMHRALVDLRKIHKSL